MNKRIPLIAALALASASATAFANDYEDIAIVKSASPQYEQVNVPRNQCYTEYVPAPRYQSSNGYAGPLIGGLAGALLGNTVGRGTGNKAATAGGAVIGAIVGDRISRNADYGGDSYHEVRRCNVVDSYESRLAGYHVVYEYAGRTYTALLPYDPGRELHVRVNVDPVGGPAHYNR
ncbi:MAG TPA: glycine zipper domain-containing protein [Burkholderiales bacterium]|nr:glycine zipper domain-containing protein [Burkholderiales bacterium]